MKKIITLKDITKKYDGKMVLNHVNLTISLNQSIAFIGHNGTGKSTLLKMIARLVVPTAGQVEHHEKLLFHYVPEHFPKMSLKAREYLSFMGRMDALEHKGLMNRIEELAGDYFLTEMLDVPMKHLSKGSLQKVGVMQALLKQPDVLLLDEPLSGQDLDSQTVFIHMMNTLREQGVTILMSCHEPFLYHSISDTIYEIREEGLIPYKAEPPVHKSYLLWFEKGVQANVPEVYEDRMIHVNGQYQMQVSQQESNPVVVNMIQKGWRLIKMEEVSHDD